LHPFPSSARLYYVTHSGCSAAGDLFRVTGGPLPWPRSALKAAQNDFGRGAACAGAALAAAGHWCTESHIIRGKAVNVLPSGLLILWQGWEHSHGHLGHVDSREGSRELSQPPAARPAERALVGGPAGGRGRAGLSAGCLGSAVVLRMLYHPRQLMPMGAGGPG